MNAKQLARKVARGVCFALALSIAGASALANIVHSAPAGWLSYGSQDIDINGDGTADFRMVSDVTSGPLPFTSITQIRLAPMASNELMAVPNTSAGTGFMMAALDPGTLISPSPDQGFLWYGTNTDRLGSALVLSCTNLGCSGAFPFLVEWESYAGIRFVVAGSVHCGWIRFWTLAGTFGEITDWAYESEPDTPIRAGDLGQPMPVTARTNGSIVFVTPNQPINYGPAADMTFTHLALDGDARTDYSLYFDIQRADIRPLRSNSLLVTRTYDDFGPNTGVAFLSYGQAVGPDPLPPPDDSFQWFDRQLDIYGYAVLGAQVTLDGSESTKQGQSSGVDGYVGLRFESGGATHYGWMHIQQDANVAAGQVLGWAYETRPDTPIKAGQWRSPLAFTATLSGSNEVPPNASTPSPTGSFTLDDSNLPYSVLLPALMTPKSAGIYGPTDPCSTPGRLVTNLNFFGIMLTNLPIAPFDSNVPLECPEQPYPLPIVGCMYQGQVTLTDTQVLELLAGRLCVNAPSTAYPRGELRGAILPATPVQLAAVLIGQTKASRSRSVFHASAAFTLTGDNLAYSLALDTNVVLSSAGVFGPTRGHTGSPRLVCALSTSLGVVVPAGGIPGQPGSPGQILYAGSAILTDRGAEELKRGECYVGLGAAAFAGGELRGEITALDNDHDGVPDYIEAYLAQICPCDGPWSSHTQYVNRVSRVAGSFAAAGWITVRQYCQIVRQAQRSSCGSVP